MKVRLNLATKALETHRRFLVGAGLTAVFAGFAFLGLGWHVYSARKVDAELRTRTERTRQEMAKLETQRKDLERYFSQKDIANLHDRAAFINTRILPGGVRVISIEPRQVAGRVEVKLTVGANSDEAELKFEHALEESKEFAEFQIQSVTSPSSNGNQSGDQKVVQLTVAYSRT